MGAASLPPFFGPCSCGSQHVVKAVMVKDLLQSHHVASFPSSLPGVCTDLLPPALKPFTVDSSLRPLLCWAELFPVHLCFTSLLGFCSSHFMIKGYSLSGLCSGLEMGPAFFQLLFKCKLSLKTEHPGLERRFSRYGGLSEKGPLCSNVCF